MMYTTQPYGSPISLLGGQQPNQAMQMKQQLMNNYAQALLSQNKWGQHYQMGQQLYNNLFARHNINPANPNGAPAMQTTNGPMATPTAGGAANIPTNIGGGAADSAAIPVGAAGGGMNQLLNMGSGMASPGGYNGSGLASLFGGK
jgi:hypothetical protein